MLAVSLLLAVMWGLFLSKGHIDQAPSRKFVPVPVDPAVSSKTSLLIKELPGRYKPHIHGKARRPSKAGSKVWEKGSGNVGSLYQQIRNNSLFEAVLEIKVSSTSNSSTELIETSHGVLPQILNLGELLTPPNPNI